MVVDNCMKTKLDKMVVIRMESRPTERTKSEKVKFVHKSEYIKQIKQALVLRRKKLF